MSREQCLNGKPDRFVVSEQERVDTAAVSGDTGSQQPVTSPPAAAAAASAGGDARATKAMTMMRTLRDTREKIGELRRRTENALAYLQQVNEERRQQLEDIQSAKTQLSLLHEQLAKIASLNINDDDKELTDAPQHPPLPDELEPSS